MSSFQTDNAVMNKVIDTARKNQGIPKGDKIRVKRGENNFEPDFSCTYVKGMYRVSINSQYVCTNASAAVAFTTAVEKYLRAMTGK